MAWTEHGPISLPPKPLAYGAGAALVVLAILGVGLGFRASLREPGAPSVGTEQAGGPDQPMIAKPIVELPAPQQAAAAKPDTNSAQEADNADTNAIDAQAAAARQVQAKSASQGGDIDQILQSKTEKPQAPAKPAADEAAPGGPDASKSDVPF
ncbi:MAG: hypothetical protein ACHP84_20640 [Caulobacterales bacterium]